MAIIRSRNLFQARLCPSGPELRLEPRHSFLRPGCEASSSRSGALLAGLRGVVVWWQIEVVAIVGSDAPQGGVRWTSGGDRWSRRRTSCVDCSVAVLYEKIQVATSCHLYFQLFFCLKSTNFEAKTS